MRVPRASRVGVDLRVFVAAVTLLVVLVAAEHASAADRIQRTGMLNGTVRAISGPDADGNRYLGGDFTAFSPWETGAGTVVDASTGAVDPSFPRVAPAGSDPANVFDSEPDGSGGVFIAGEFGSVDGQPRYGLARILVDGSVDPAWTAGLTVGSGSWISDIELVGGVLYVVGSFSGVAAAPGGAATTRYNAAAFDVSTGALKNWNPATNVANTGASGPVVVTSIAIGSGQAFLGGNFNCLNVTVLTGAAACPTANPGVERTALAAVDLTTGAVVAAFNAALGGGRWRPSRSNPRVIGSTSGGPSRPSMVNHGRMQR
jgi:hypothetical protein